MNNILKCYYGDCSLSEKGFVSDYEFRPACCSSDVRGASFHLQPNVVSGPQVLNHRSTYQEGPLLGNWEYRECSEDSANTNLFPDAISGLDDLWDRWLVSLNIFNKLNIVCPLLAGFYWIMKTTNSSADNTTASLHFCPLRKPIQFLKKQNKNPNPSVLIVA